jgi:integrase/recombinase XerC
VDPDSTLQLPGVPVLATPADVVLVEEFIAMSDRDEKTRHKYRRHLLELKAWLQACAGGKRLLEVTKPDVVRFLADLKEGKRFGVGADGRPLTGALDASSRKGVISALRSFYRHCADLYGFERDPTFGVRAPRVAYKRGVTLTESELRAFLDAPGDERDRVQAYLSVYTAARTSSLRFLRWRDVDFEGDLIHFQAKRDRDYTLPLHPQLRAALLRWREVVLDQAQRNPAVRAALSHPDTAYVLLTRNGRPLCHSTLAKQAKWRAARVGILPHPPSAHVGHENKSQVTPHAFRRSFAQIQRSRGVELADLADALNHKDVNTTRNHYAYTDTPRLRETVTSFRV